MTVQVSTLDWKAWNKDKASYVATVPVNFTTDKIWIINIASNQQWTPENVIPAFVCIDNIGNNAVVTVDFGPFQTKVSQFVRESYAIPPTVQRLIITGDVDATGEIQVLLSTERLAADTVNQLAINQAGGQDMELPVKYITATVAQIPTDGAKCLVFNPAANMTYSLLDILANNLTNGYFMFVQNMSDFTVTISPAGTDVINSVFSNAAPLILYKGSSGILKCDGLQWFFQGQLTWESAEQAIAVSTKLTIAHTLGKETQRWSVWLRCKIANNNYAVGDEVYLGHGPVNPTMSYPFFQAADKANTIRYIQGASLPNLLNANTGATFAIVAANWRTVLRSMVQW